MNSYYIASCNFTSQFPELSLRIQKYAEERYGLTVVRCCIPNYKLKMNEEKMPEGRLREAWKSLPDSAAFESGDEIYSLCHNCNNIIEEMHEGVHVHSLFELIDQDDAFVFPDFHGMHAFVQDCWRSRERKEEQDAVRSLLTKMNIHFEEAREHHEQTDFCGISLLRPQPARNPRLAPKQYVEQAEGKFLEHTEEEQKKLMEEYCMQFGKEKVICYCHYCLEGLLAGNADACHLAHLLFGE